VNTDERLLFEARQRAEAYARQRPDDDVPRGWVLEEASVAGTYHFRRVGVANYEPPYSMRQDALAEILRLNAEKPATP
jgi:hypothetical protein